MNVMNIKHYLSAAAALALFAACSEYDPGMSENVVDYTDEELKVLNEYAENFAEHFGGIDPDHTWGFGEKGSMDETLSTRTSTNNPNNNQWVHLSIDQDTREITNVTTIDNQAVPGFPSSVDGLYHYYMNGTPTASDWATIQNLVKNGQKDEFNPVGDVTDEEILYVSAWFRNHKNPTSDPLNVDKFFTQCISKDHDRTSYASETGLINEGTSNWSEGSGVGEWNRNIPINLYKNGVYSTVDRNGQNATGQYRQEDFRLDHLDVKAPGDAEYVHIYNNNAGNTSTISSTAPTAINTDTWSALGQGIVSDQSYRSIMYVNETGTTDFRAWSSGGSEWDYKWVLKNLKFTGRDGKEYDGWYLAFDVKYYRVEETSYDDNNNEWKKISEKDYDGYYSNYIVKITPGNGSVTPDWYRIMCEDLGNTYDYDFNDLVYDVYYTGQAPNYTAHIKVQAAGGTYPIFLGAHNEAHEVHHMLGHGDTYNETTKLYQPINVGTGLTSAPYEFTLSINSTNPDDIPIYVENPAFQGARTKNDFTLPRVGENLTDAPQKICIPGNTVKWTLENKNIELAYPKFTDWVNNMQGDCDFGKTNDWTKTNVQETYLFK